MPIIRLTETPPQIYTPRPTLTEVKTKINPTNLPSSTPIKKEISTDSLSSLFGGLATAGVGGYLGFRLLKWIVQKLA